MSERSERIDGYFMGPQHPHGLAGMVFGSVVGP